MTCGIHDAVVDGEKFPLRRDGYARSKKGSSVQYDWDIETP